MLSRPMFIHCEDFLSPIIIIGAAFAVTRYVLADQKNVDIILAIILLQPQSVTRSFSVVRLATLNGLPIDLIHLRNSACSQSIPSTRTQDRLFFSSWPGSGA